MKKDICRIIKYLECENSKIAELRGRFYLLDNSQPEELDLVGKQLQDAIKGINTQNHEAIHTFYFFLGCIYYEQDSYEKAVDCLGTAVIGAWESRINRSLTKWMLARIFFTQEDFPKARLELEEALRLLETSAVMTSLRADIQNGKRQAIRQEIMEMQAELANKPFFRSLPPDPQINTDTPPTGQPSKGQPPERKDAAGPDLTADIPAEEIPAYQETLTGGYMPDPRRTETSSEFPETAGIDPMNQDRTDGYLSIPALPVYEQNVAAGKPGFPLSPLENFGYAEIQVIILKSKPYRIHSIKRKDNEIKITQNEKLGWVKVVGKSMNKIQNRTPIDNGDFVLSKFTETAEDNDIVLASIEDPQTTQIRLVVKRYRKELQVLRSESTEKGEDYKEIDMRDKDRVKISGIVLAVAKPI